MDIIPLILILSALILFILSGFNTPSRFSLIAFGLACCTAAWLVERLA